ncbi:non-canonical purine NTP pyrophosphatase [Candidatus Roizmanbacteria bacterium]|nr:non-canonical purine NTP pyrophosphatase [Candidatus Roizmanbacteria bacterium]
MIAQLLVATHNKAKLGELMMGMKKLTDQGVKILSLNDLKISEDPEETGKTFEENSILKAKFYGSLTRLPTLADDGGLHIEVLDGALGIKSKRWLGRDASDLELIEYTLKRLEGLPKSKRVAYLETSLCFFDPKSNTLFNKQERIRGYIAEKQSGRPTLGYPYRALFVIEKWGRYYDELTEEEHHAISHRLKALRWMVDKIVKS